MIQSELILREARSDSELADALKDGVLGTLQLHLTRNRVSMASVRFYSRGRVVLRLHEAFRAAPDEVIGALGAYMQTRRREDWAVVAAFARTIQAERRAPVRVPKLETKGRVWDLDVIAEEVNRTFFEGRVQCRVGWGRGRPQHQSLRHGAGQGAAATGWLKVRRAGRSIRYGSWDVATRTVRIHPLLDDVRVPQEFVRYIVFHEMLHAEVPEVRHRGRRYVHSAQFRLLERRFPELKRMGVLARELLEKLV